VPGGPDDHLTPEQIRQAAREELRQIQLEKAARARLEAAQKAQQASDTDRQE